jgi:type IV pilus assembly protein PilX
MNRPFKNQPEVCTMKHPLMHRPPPREQGVVLAIGLLILVIMTLIGVTAMTTTSLENKMAGNLKDWNLALQAAEAGLRDAETDVAISGRVSGKTNAVDNCAALLSSPSDQDGQCLSPVTATTNLWQTIDWTESASPVKYVKYGRFTAAPGYTSTEGFAALPRYIIEPMDSNKPGEDNLTFPHKTKTFRITVVGYGGTTDANVMLQSTYVLP